MKNVKNHIRLIGNLGRDPELKNFDNGKNQVRFSMATNDFFRDSEGNKKENTQWHNIVAWGKTAETMDRLLKKGSQVLVEGKLTHRSYEDKKGITRYISEILVNQFMVLSKNDLPF